MRRVLTWLGVAAAIPVLLVGALWLGQERMIFLPDGRVIAAAPGWTRETLRAPDGTELAFLLAEGSPARPVILHFHGNGGNAEDRTGLGDVLRNLGFGVVLAEYRGYGGNAGRPGEAAIATDAAAYLAWVRGRFAGRPLVLWGESLGTAVVTRLAEGRSDIAAVVLESPFTSVADLARSIYPLVPTDHLLRHRFESLPRLAGLRAPLFVVASEDDRITPVAHARLMAEAGRGRLLLLPGSAHPAVLNDASGQGLRAVLDFLASVGRN